MEIKTKVRDFESLNADNKVFSVDTDNSVVISLLRDKMYKNKIAAVCREIASNSRDANREAGRGDKPITIRIDRDNNLLSEEDITISFIDNGIGISPERMEKIFLKYGGSTKRETNEFTGGFGIGAKTPFAYTDNFLITTVVEENGKRIKYYYQAAITSNGKKEITRMIDLGNEETTDLTGTAITVPLKKESDLDKFEKEVLYATSLWETKPELVNFKTKSDLQVHFENEDFMLVLDREYETFSRNTKYIALIDGIPYEIDKGKFHSTQGKELYSNKNKLKWVLKFNTGEVSVSGSREDIEYIDENEKTIVDKVNKKVLPCGEKLIKEFINDVSSYKEACIVSSIIDRRRSPHSFVGLDIDSEKYDFIDDKFNGMVFNFLGSVAYKLDYKNQDIYPDYEGSPRMSSLRMKSMEIHNMYINSSGRLLKGNSMSWYGLGHSDWNKPTYFMDLAKAEPTRNAMLKQLHPEGYILFEKNKLDVNHKNFGHNLAKQNEDFKKDLEILRKLEITLKPYSEVEKLRKTSDRRKTTDIIEVPSRTFKKDRRHWQRKDWENLKLKYDKGNKEFIKPLESIRAVLEGEVVNSFVYFEVDKMNKFNESGQVISYDTIPGMTKGQNAVRALLHSVGIVVVGTSSSKSKYFKEAGVETMEEMFKKVLETNTASKVIKDCMKYTILKSFGIGAEVLEEVKFDKDLKDSYDSLLKVYDRLHKKIEKDVTTNTIYHIVKYFNQEYANSIGLKLDKKFDEDLEKITLFIEDNLMLKMIVKIQKETKNSGTNCYINPHDDYFKNAIQDYVGKLNS
jgi:hypothetical protein